jgi:hypothetical protein
MIFKTTIQNKIYANMCSIFISQFSLHARGDAARLAGELSRLSTHRQVITLTCPGDPAAGGLVTLPRLDPEHS